MDELQALQHQLEEVRDEAELNLLMLQQVQEELEFYFLRCQELETALNNKPEAAAPSSESQTALQDLSQERDAAQQARDLAMAERDVIAEERDNMIKQAEQKANLFSTAQRMLEGQASYLEDVSSREEQAAQALDRIRLLEAEILYYIQHSKPLSSLDPGRINRLIELAKQANPAQRPANRR